MRRYYKNGDPISLYTGCDAWRDAELECRICGLAFRPTVTMQVICEDCSDE